MKELLTRQKEAIANIKALPTIKSIADLNKINAQLFEKRQAQKVINLIVKEQRVNNVFVKRAEKYARTHWRFNNE